jgi:membrane protease YdiL (CAAX protease family)
MNLGHVLRQDIAPVGSAYLVFVIVFVWYATRQRGRPGTSEAVPTRRATDVMPLLRSVAVTIAGGYLVFAVIITIFYLVLGEQPSNFIPQSLVQGSVLAFGIVLPSFVALTLAEATWRRRDG